MGLAENPMYGSDQATSRHHDVMHIKLWEMQHAQCSKAALRRQSLWTASIASTARYTTRREKASSSDSGEDARPTNSPPGPQTTSSSNGRHIDRLNTRSCFEQKILRNPSFEQSFILIEMPRRSLPWSSAPRPLFRPCSFSSQGRRVRDRRG